MTPPVTTRSEARREIARCLASPAYFIHHYCHLYTGGSSAEGDTTADVISSGAEWIPFRLWPAQVAPLQLLERHRLIVWLKARQLGMTWLALGYTLHTLLLGRPGSTTLLFSRRDKEATELLKRLKGIYQRLPDFLKAVREDDGNAHEWVIPGLESRCLAFPTTAGDSYTATLAVVDEADLVPDLNRLLGAAKPTIDAGGRMLLLSRPDKDEPLSTFKAIYRSARDDPKSPWKAIFLPWHCRPGRTRAWYEEQKAASLAQTGSLDWLYEHYPETDEQALAGRILNNRIPPAWLEAVSSLLPPLSDDELRRAVAPALPHLRVWKAPEKGCKYVVGADPAQGNPTSDDSAASLLDARSGEQVAVFAGKLDPAVFAQHLDKVGTWYNHAPVMVERNNHGHAVLLWLREHSRLRRLRGHDREEGWLSSTTGKVLLYDACTESIRQRNVMIHDDKTRSQLGSIEGATLRAPEGLHDDAADGFALAVAGMPQAGRETIRMESFG